jgi:hypothetical protein
MRLIITSDETQTRPLGPERDQKETYSRPKGDLFTTSASVILSRSQWYLMSMCFATRGLLFLLVNFSTFASRFKLITFARYF